MTDPAKNVEMVHEAVGVFNDADSLQAALDDLQINGFARHEISVLSSDKTIEEKLGHIYKRVEEAEDDPEAPRTIFVPIESIGDAEGALIGTPLYIAVAATAAVTVASGGTLFGTILAITAAGAVGAGIGDILASFVAKHHADYIQDQIDHGGLLLWVNLRSPDLEEKAKEILSKHSAHGVHIHEIPLYG
jgi:hypothetical protein